MFAFLLFVSTITSILALYEAIQKNRFHSRVNIRQRKNSIPISILVPGYNEETTIVQTIESLIHLDYELYEIVVVNDGSTDKTADKVIKHFEMEQVHRPIRRIVPCKKVESIFEKKGKVKITLINKENGGKSDALNMGINACSFPYFITMDADSILQKDSLSNIILPVLEHKNIIAVGGNIKVSNNVVLRDGEVVDVKYPKNPLVIFQLLEYFRVFLTTRIWFSDFNGTMIVSGAFGLFKKEAVKAVGGYDLDTIGEDMGLIVKLHSYHKKNDIDYRISYEPFAICWSQVPENVKDLMSQRSRWHVGLMQSILSHRYIFFNKKYGVIGMFVFIYISFFEMIASIIEIFGIGFILVAFYSGFLNLKFFVIIFLFYTAYSFIVTSSALMLERYIFKTKVSRGFLQTLLLFSFIEPFGYRQMISYFRIVGLYKFFKKDNKWGKIKRFSHDISH
jgi:cellulose synthase/poly-beta-1,6-N-acetylglucosamine synthase-like glycosyltransferase